MEHYIYVFSKFRGSYYCMTFHYLSWDNRWKLQKIVVAPMSPFTKEERLKVGNIVSPLLVSSQTEGDNDLKLRPPSKQKFGTEIGFPPSCFKQSIEVLKRDKFRLKVDHYLAMCESLNFQTLLVIVIFWHFTSNLITWHYVMPCHSYFVICIIGSIFIRHIFLENLKAGCSQ